MLKTQKYGLVANPVKHSLSPKIHQMGYQFYNLAATYELLALKGSSKDILTYLFDHQYQGVNLSMPYKQAFLGVLDEVDAEAALIQSVNTVKFVDGKSYGISTDGLGFWQDYQQRFKNLPVNCLVLGDGGAATAIIATAAKLGIQTIFVARRHGSHYQKRSAIIRQIADLYNVKIISLDYGESLLDILPQVTCLINATSVGMLSSTDTLLSKKDLQLLPKQATVSDIIYTPQKTVLLKNAAQLGLRINNGIGMLVQQASLSFAFWTGQPLPIAKIKEQLNDYQI